MVAKNKEKTVTFKSDALTAMVDMFIEHEVIETEVTQMMKAGKHTYVEFGTVKSTMVDIGNVDITIGTKVSLKLDEENGDTEFTMTYTPKTASETTTTKKTGRGNGPGPDFVAHNRIEL